MSCHGISLKNEGCKLAKVPQVYCRDVKAVNETAALEIGENGSGFFKGPEHGARKVRRRQVARHRVPSSFVLCPPSARANHDACTTTCGRRSCWPRAPDIAATE